MGLFITLSKLFQYSLVPRPPPFFVLRFAFFRVLYRTQNRRTKNRGGLGARLVSVYNLKFLGSPYMPYIYMQIKLEL